MKRFSILLRTLIGVPVAFLLIVVLATIGFGFYYERATTFERETAGPLPFSRLEVTRRHGKAVEFYVLPDRDTPLTTSVNMTLFGPAEPGQTTAEFVRRFGREVIDTETSLVRPEHEVSRSGSATHEIWVAIAFPKPGRLGFRLADVLCPFLAAKVRTLQLDGDIHIHNGSSTEFVTCTVHNGVVTRLRWARRAA